MIIENAILHIMDSEQDSLICTRREMDLSQVEIYEYLEKLTTKVMQTDAKTGFIPEESQVRQILEYPDFDFVDRSIELVNLWFSLGRGCEDLPSGDYIVEQFEEEGKHYFAVIKLNHKVGFTHFLQYDDDEIVNQLIANRHLLPTATTKPDEALVVEIETLKYRLLEKRYKVDGKRHFYLSEDLLQVQPTRTVNDSLKVIKKAVQEIATDFNEEDYVASSSLQEAVYEAIEEHEALEVDEIGQKLYEGQPEKQEHYQAKLEEAGLTSQPIINPSKLAERYYKQKFKLDNGIEITIPMDVYQDKDAIEFINQPDGSLAVMIKNIDEIKNRF